MKFTIDYTDYNGELAHENFSTDIFPALEWIQDSLTDPDICAKAQWYPTKKFIEYQNSRIEIKDDLDCGDDWWENQVSHGIPKFCFRSVLIIALQRQSLTIEVYISH